jgi:gluconokinase
VIVVVMGVSGSGKTTVGRLLAASLGATFMDADDFHPPENVAKMRAGRALDDADRAPWLARLHEELARHATRDESVVLACSALKIAYRDALSRGLDVAFVHLAGSREVIGARLASRSGHYMPPSLLDSQFAALESPPDAITVDIDAAPEAIVAHILATLGGGRR